MGILTMLTQVGGILYLFYKPLGLTVEERVKRRWIRLPVKIAIFGAFLTVSSLWIVPRFAIGYGRVPLPFAATDSLPLQPAGQWLWLANRHYVDPELLEAIGEVARRVNKKYPGTTLTYLDANFPFLNGFPLIPHLSHDDGQKLDLCFLYKDPATGERVNGAPAWLGYGFSEAPRPDEYDQPGACEKQGHWQYSFLSKWMPKKKKAGFAFDEPANTDLLRIIARQKSVQKIFIEPHLKTRLGLQNLDKIRFQGCHSVRHDDHIHLQVN